MSLSFRKDFVYSLLLLICYNLNNGCALELNCSQTRNCSIQASQSSTYLTCNASRAVDGDLNTRSETISPSEGWWKVYLGDVYCLRNIIVVTKGVASGMQGAVLRAGLNSNNSQNIKIGAPLTEDQVQNGLDFNLTVDPIVLAQYVSVEHTFNSVAIGELMVEEITESGITSTMSIGVDLTLVTNILLTGQSVNNEPVIKAYKGCSDLTANVSFGRQLSTGGTNTGLPVEFLEADDPILGRAAKSLAFPGTGGMDRVGVFYSEASKGGRSTRIQTIILPSDDTTVHIRPEQRSLTVNAGESVTLRMINKNSPNNTYRWKHNGTAKDEWNNQLNVSIPSVNKTDEGIYSCFVDGQEDQQLHGIMRLIVRDCPSEMWGPPMCTNTCRRCYNGGICDDKTGTCVCAPGFSGENCLTVHGRNVFGKDAQYKCSNSTDLHNPDCRGHLFCLPDPYGCSCAAGYMGLDCNTGCSNGTYGADCKQTCHCKDQVECHPVTGKCDSGCEPSYFGENCQCPQPGLWIIGPVVGSLVLLVFVFIRVYFKCRKVCNDPLYDSSRPMEVSVIFNNQIPPVMELQPSTAVRLIEDKHIYENNGLPTWAIGWEIKWKHLVVEDTILGKGNFGEVHLGRVNTKGKVTEAAVKTLKGGASQDADNFLKEFQTMIEIGLHPNIVGLLGACFNEGTLYVALEFLPGDNLHKYLRENRQIQLQGQHSQSKDSPVTLSQLLKFGVDVSKGMQHLAEAGIIHRDLAARNILLGEELIAKISDFGLSRGEHIYVQESKTRIPLRWLAFESLMYHLYVSKSDVWSFGVLLWEIVTFGGTPYPGVHNRELPGKLIDGYRMPQPENCPDDIYNLMLNCWKKAPNKRPSFKEITDALEKIRQVLAIKTNTSLAVYENFGVIVQEFDDH